MNRNIKKGDWWGFFSFSGEEDKLGFGRIDFNAPATEPFGKSVNVLLKMPDDERYAMVGGEDGRVVGKQGEGSSDMSGDVINEKGKQGRT